MSAVQSLACLLLATAALTAAAVFHCGPLLFAAAWLLPVAARHLIAAEFSPDQ